MADKPQIANPSPKTRFQIGNGNIAAHRSMLELLAFDRGADAALLEYGKLLAGQSVDGNSAMAAGFRMQGAVEFLSFLKTLAETTVMPPPRRDLDNLPNITDIKRQ